MVEILGSVSEVRCMFRGEETLKRLEVFISTFFFLVWFSSSLFFFWV